MDSLILEGVSHRYGELLAVDGVDLKVRRGELLCLLGPSGCGKTTILRLIAGLEHLQSGRIELGGRPVADAATDVPPEERGVGLLFQDYALFPHLTVLENVAFGLKELSREKSYGRGREVLALVGMSDYETSYPHTLSGGQQQRVALARALAPGPRVMLLDEPFSGLDARLRNQIRDETLHILKKTDATAVMVTHDPEEAMFMADRVALMRGGRLIQVGRPTELYFNPKDAFVAAFFGEINRLAGKVRAGRVSTPFGEIDGNQLADETPVEVLIRPEALRLVPLDGRSPAQGGAARVLAARMLGRSSLVHLSVESGGGEPLHIHARIPGRYLPAEDERLCVQLDHAQAFVFPAERAT